MTSDNPESNDKESGAIRCDDGVLGEMKLQKTAVHQECRPFGLFNPQFSLGGQEGFSETV